MIVKIYPENTELTTSLPLSIQITDYEGEPVLKVGDFGVFNLKKHPVEGLKSDFHFALPGRYEITITDQRETQSLVLQVKESRYLNFSEEFGFFFSLFLIVMLGVYLWVRKVMKPKI